MLMMSLIQMKMLPRIQVFFKKHRSINKVFSLLLKGGAAPFFI